MLFSLPIIKTAVRKRRSPISTKRPSFMSCFISLDFMVVLLIIKKRFYIGIMRIFQLFKRSFQLTTSADQGNDPVTDLTGAADIVCNNDGRSVVLAPHIIDQLVDLHRRNGIESGGRLI